MRIRLLPLAGAGLAVLLARQWYLAPTDATLAGERAKDAALQAERATVAAHPTLAFQVEQQRRALAVRLSGVRAGDAEQSEADLLRDLAQLARRERVAIVALRAKGNPMPVATPMPSASPRAGAAPEALRVRRLPRSLRIVGHFADLVRFVDALGSLPDLVAVRTVALAQSEQLSASVDLDLIVIDPRALVAEPLATSAPT